jgi:hypothetical protein
MKCKIRAGWSNHFPVLYRIIPLVKDSVLELGIGFYSTPFLHWMCIDKGLRLESYEKDKTYIRWFKDFNQEEHKIIAVDDWDKADIDKHWGLVFVDHDDDRRPIEIIRLANNADYIIMHDTQDEEYNNIKSIWSHFKYIKHFNSSGPRTTILSNFYEVKDI